LQRLILVGTCVLLLAFIAAVIWAGNHLTRAAPGSTGAVPAALGARALTFPSASGATLSAWFVQGDKGRGAVLLLHPIRANKRAMLARAQFLERAGFSVLLLDLRAHGESEGERVTFGYREGLDVRAATAKLAELAPGEKVGALGVSLGAAAIAFSDVQDKLGAIVLESLYADIEDAIRNRLRINLGAAGPLLAPLLLAQIEPRLGIPAKDLRPLDRLASLRAPVLFVHGAEDRHTTLAEAERMYAAAAGPKALYVIHGAAHVDLHAFSGPAYERRIVEFFSVHLREPRE